MGEHEDFLAKERARLQRAAFSRGASDEDVAALAEFERQRVAAAVPPSVDPPETDIAKPLVTRRRWLPVALGLSVVLVIGVIVAVRPMIATSSAGPEPAASATGPASSTAVSPVAAYSGTASCYNLVDVDSIRTFTAEGWSEGGAAFVRVEGTDTNSPIYPFVVAGGLVCAWGDANQVLYAYAPISADDALNEQAKLVVRNIYRSSTSKGITTYEAPGAAYIFGKGYWLYTATSPTDLSDQLVAHVPENAGRERTDLQSSLYVTSEGLGDLRLGRPVPKDTKLVEWKPNVCDIAAGGYRPTGEYSEGSILPFEPITTTRTRRGLVSALYIYSPRIPTKSGIRVGDAVAKVEKAFPGIEKKKFELAGTVGKIKFVIGGVDPDHPQDVVVLAIYVARLHDQFPVNGTDPGGTCPS